MTSGDSTVRRIDPFGDGDVLLADTSVWRRADRFPDAVAKQWERALTGDRIAMSPPVMFELLYYVRLDRCEFDRWRGLLTSIYRNLRPDVGAWALASDAYVELAHSSQLTGKSMTDILVAATAARNNIPVLHIDKDYESLADLSCFAGSLEVRRLIPRGTQV